METFFFSYNPNRFAGWDEDDSDMEANFDEIMKEEKRRFVMLLLNFTQKVMLN